MSQLTTSETGKVTWRLRTDDGVELYVEATRADEGADPSGAPVLLINGITMSTESWNQLGRLLRQERPVVRYDMRGQGASDAPAGPYTRERHARDLLGLLQDLSERGLTPLHVVALSNGGYVTQLLLGWLHHAGLAAAAGLSESQRDALAERGDDILSLTLLDTFARVDARLHAAVRSWLNALAAGGAPTRFDAATPWVWGPDFLAANGEALAEARELAAGQPQDAVESLLEGLLASAETEPDLTPVLSQASLPLLVALGEDDVLTPVRNHREVLEQFGRDPEQVRTVPRAGHAAPIENAAGVAALVRPFLRKHDVPGGVDGRGVAAM